MENEFYSTEISLSSRGNGSRAFNYFGLAFLRIIKKLSARWIMNSNGYPSVSRANAAERIPSRAFSRFSGICAAFIKILDGKVNIFLVTAEGAQVNAATNCTHISPAALGKATEFLS